MLNIRYKEIKVRRKNSHLHGGDDRFTGAVTYSVIGRWNGERIRLALGTDQKNVALRRIAKIENAVADGPTSSLWPELNDAIPPATFKYFADRVGYVRPNRATAKMTWQDLCDAFEAEMQRLIDNKKRGADSEEGTMADSTRQRYRQTIRHFTDFLADPGTQLEKIDAAVIKKFKIDRNKKILALKQNRGGGSVALDVAVLHRMFAFAVAEKILANKPIDLSRESKPGRNPKNGARPLTGEELANVREAAKYLNSRKEMIDDTFIILTLRWTGLRRSDAVALTWKNIYFDRGANGEVETTPQKTQRLGKVAIIPLSTELRIALDDVYRERKPHPEDRVLFNPETGSPFSSGARLSERVKALCARAGVKGGSAHCFRDTFACDMLAKGNGVFEVAKMLADTVDTVEKYYAQFVPAARDSVQIKMDSGVGIEEQARLARQRGQKVIQLGEVLGLGKGKIARK